MGADSATPTATGASVSMRALLPLPPLLALTWCIATPDRSLPIALLLITLCIFAYKRNHGILLLPGALIGVFVPLRTLGALLANDLLAGPLQTAHFLVSAQTRTYTAIAVAVVVFAANAFPVPQRFLRRLAEIPTLAYSTRLLCWILFTIATIGYVAKVDGIPILMSDAENFRVTAQFGNTYLIYLAYVPALGLAIDSGTRMARQLASPARTYTTLMLIMLGLMIPGNRLPAAMALFSFTAAAMSGYASQGQRRQLPFWAAFGALAVMASVVGAFRASYVGTQKGLIAGPAEHLLRRAAADAGNTDLIIRSSQSWGSELFSPLDFLIRPFAVYLPGGQENLGQYMKSALGLTFDGGGITVGLAAESVVTLGALGLVIIPTLAGLFAGGVTQHILRFADTGREVPYLSLQLASLAFINLGNAGLTEMLATSFIPFLVIGVAILVIGRTLNATPLESH